MRTAVFFVCVSLGLALPQLTNGGDKKGKSGGGGGGGKAARAAGGGGGRAGRFGGGGGGGAAHAMGGRHMGGGGQNAAHNNFGGGQGAHGLNARHGGQGLNAQRHAGAGGLNARAQNGIGGGRHAANNFGRQGVNRQFARQNRFVGRGAHWREGTRWRDSHTVIAGYRARGRVWHDHVWWGSHYDVVEFGGGWGPWYWDGGYWFPAWGYAPAFTYAWDCPVYAYANLPPDQVVVNVQEALQDQGYYRGNIDGVFGPETRDAVDQYQRDHNLELTAAIDEPTVVSLGLITEQA